MGASARALPALLALLVVAALPLLAAASPPDPGWIPGVYDDGDHDDVVAAVGATEGIGDAAMPLLEGPRLLALGLVPASEAGPAAASLPASPSRAPPGC